MTMEKPGQNVTMPTEIEEGNAVIKVVGTGGGGNNAVKRMRQAGLKRCRAYSCKHR